jgi:hypothetical protein
MEFNALKIQGGKSFFGKIMHLTPPGFNPSG